MFFYFVILNLSLLIFSLGWAAQGNFSPASWAKTWIMIAGFAGLCRLLLWICPGNSTLISQLLLLGLGVYGINLLRKRAAIFQKESAIYFLPILLMLVLVFLRALYPEVDIDSIAYHQNAMLWLRFKSELPTVLQDFRLTDLRFMQIGTEDFLLTPGLGEEVMLYGGILSGIIKILGVLSAISLLPRSFYLGKYLVAFFILIDDHFFFSSQSTFVFVNPALVALMPICLYLWLRILRGKLQDIGVFLASCLALATFKQYGVFLATPCALVLIFWLVKSIKMRIAVAKLFTKENLIYLTLGFFAVMSVYGSNIVMAGSPFYPYSFGPFQIHAKMHPMYTYLVMKKSLLGYLVEDGHRLITYSGIMTSKLIVLFAPFLLIYLSWKRSALRSPWFSLLFVFAGFVIYWNLLNSALDYIEVKTHGRYARYALSVGALFIPYGLLYLRKLFKGRCDSYQRILVLGFGFLLSLYIIGTLDSRYYNVASGNRPNWEEWVEFHRRGSSSKLMHEKPFSRILEVGAFVNDLHECFSKLTGDKFKLYDPHWHSEYSTVIFSGHKNWPGVFFMPTAIRLDTMAMVQVDEPANFEDWYKETSLKYMIASPTDGPENYIHQDGYGLKEALLRKVKSKTPICEAGPVNVYEMI